MAYLAYHLHWDYDELGALPHRERQRWVEEVGRLNRSLEDSAQETY